MRVGGATAAIAAMAAMAATAGMAATGMAGTGTDGELRRTSVFDLVIHAPRVA